MGFTDNTLFHVFSISWESSGPPSETHQIRLSVPHKHTSLQDKMS